MKKAFLLLTVLSFSAFASFAQITLGSSDLSHANDIYLMSDATAFQGMDETVTGTNFTWDYSQLSGTTTGQHTDTFFTVTNMNIIYQAVFGDFSFLPHRSNQATHAPDFTLGTQISVSNAFNFYYNNSNDYHQSGFGAEINGIPLPTAYSPHDILYRFPLQYNDMDTSHSGYSVSIPNFLYYGVNRTRINEVDGWGTLITPSGTYSVLRVKSIVQERDSVFLDTLGFGYGFNLPTQTEYKWLGQGEGVPLLQVNVAGGFVTSVVYKGQNTTGVQASREKISDLLVFPNPASDKIFLKYSLQAPQEVEFTITDLQGNKISSTLKKALNSGGQVMVLDLPNGIPSGNYMVTMKSGSAALSKAFVVGN